MCLYPKLIKNRKYMANKKNGGDIPPLPKVYKNGKLIDDTRVLQVPVGCGKCIECMKEKANEWRVRLMEEVIYNEQKGIFVTLTFNNESIRKIYYRYFQEEEPGYLLDNLIAKKAVRLFLERWRQRHGKSVKHWLITELGHNGTENIHLHGIIWTDLGGKEINDVWNYGFTWCSDDNSGWVNEQTVNYIIKYCTKMDSVHPNYKPKILTSPGIGKGFVKSRHAAIAKFNGTATKEYYVHKDGSKGSLPIYYRNKLYSEKEREKLWINKLEINNRYVLGQKINMDLPYAEEKYYNTLRKAQKKNKRLGFGDDSINWDKWEYEKKRRKLNYEKRLKNI